MTSRRRWILGLALLVGVLACVPDVETDPFWHMTLGRAVLTAGSRVVPEPVALPAFTDAAVVPEWAWSLVTLAAWTAGGGIALSLTGVGSGLALGGALGALVDRLGSTPAGRLLVGVPAACIVAIRVRPRPESLALAGLVVGYGLARRYAVSPDRRVAIVLVALQVGLAQLHGSFVLLPIVVAVTVLPRAPGLVAALLAGCLTSAYGLDVGSYLAHHAGGYAVHHVGDMRPSTWETFGPAGGPTGPLYLGLLALGVCGRSVRSWALALVGVLLAVQASRFVTVAAVFTVPLALEGADARFGRARGLATLVALFAVGWTATSVDRALGPLGRLGLDEEALPLAAAAHFSTAPAETPVLTSFAAGAPIAFLAAGHVRTYVDARTPLYFGDRDYAVARELFRSPEALARGLDRFGAQAVVMERDRPVCPGFFANHAPAVVEARFSTWDAAAPPLAAITACGPEYLAPDACAVPGQLAADVARLRAVRPSAFVDYLDAERHLRCDGDAAGATALVPSEGESRAFAAARRRLLARLALTAGAPERAAALLDEDLRAGDLVALRILMGRLEPALGYRVLGEVAAALDDDTPADVQAALASACVAVGDAEGAAFWGLRAAARGADVAPVLGWLTEHGVDARTRADAERWQ